MINPEARVWIYQSNRPLNQNQLTEINAILKDFTASWSAHNQALKAGFEIKYDRFIVLIVDETQAGASGCSIDKSVHLMQELEKKFQINLLDRFNIAYKIADKVESVDRSGFEELIKAGTVDASTTVFNNMVNNYQDYQNKWETTIANSWHSSVFAV
nr:ABC transporter ATPase [uncultured Pedobacter sp.]